MELKNASQVTILIADDSVVMQKLLETSLKPLGARKILFAKDGIETLSWLKKSTIDVLFLDINMPVYDGFSIANYLHSTHQTRTHVVLISSNLNAKNIEKAEKLAIKYYLQKPINTQRLKYIFGEVLREIDQQNQASGEVEPPPSPTADKLQ